MRVSRKMLARLAGGALFLCAFSGLDSSARAQQAQLTTQQAGQQSARYAGPNALPDSPGAAIAESKAPSPLLAAESQNPQAGQTGNSQNQSRQSAAPGIEPLQRPVGTAAAEAPSTSGIAASEPAGAAIAPAKQHRARTIVIRTGAIIAGAAAIGAVVALSAATGSKPPGAH